MCLEVIRHVLKVLESVARGGWSACPRVVGLWCLSFSVLSALFCSVVFARAQGPYSV